MRVCFLEDTMLHGGTQIWVTEAALKFMEMGVDVTILSPESGFVAKTLAESGARIVTYGYDSVVDQSDAQKAIWRAAFEDSDVVVCTVHPPRDGFHCSVFAGAVIKEAGLNTVLIPKTGTIVPDYLREYYCPVEGIRNRVIAITNFTREYLVSDYQIPESVADLVYQGTEVARFTPDPARKADARERYPVPEGAGPILGNVGSFEERKGQGVLLDAVAACRDRLPGIHLILVGDGPDEAMLKERVESMGLQDCVTFFPFTREPVYVFEAIDILVLSSLYKEGLPNVLLEAMSMHLPVVSSRMAGVPEVVFDGETGYMVEPGDVQQLADGIVRCWTDQDQYARMAANARKLMEDKFDKKVQFGAFVEYFDRVLADYESA